MLAVFGVALHHLCALSPPNGWFGLHPGLRGLHHEIFPCRALK